MKFNKIFFFTLLIVTFTLPALALDSIIFDDNFSMIKPALSAEYLIDSKKSLSIGKILADKTDDMLKWQKSNQESLGFGFTKDTYWVRFQVSNPTGKKIEWMLEQKYPLIDHISLFVPGMDGQYKEIKTGDKLPFSKRPYRYKNFVFPLTLGPGDTDTYFLRFESTSAININLVCWSNKAFEEHVYTETPVMWMFYGFFIIMFVYNLLLFLSLRDISYFYYIVWIAVFTLLHMSLTGVAVQFLWPRSVWWSNICIPVFLGLAVFSLVQFGRHLTKFWEISKPVDNLLKALVIIALIASAVTLIFNSDEIALIATDLIVAIALVVGGPVSLAVIVMKKVRSKQLFFVSLSFLFFIVGSALFLLKTFALLPETFWTTHGIQIGAAMQIILISLCLADKINTANNELKALNTGLEDEVQNRTQKLIEANDKLKEMDRLKTDFFANITHEIRTPLTLILSPVESVLQGEYSKEVDKAFAENIQRNAIRLLRLVNNILDFSKIKEGKMTTVVREVDFAKLLKNYTETIKPAAESKGVEVSFVSSTESLPLFLDSAKADRIAMNLLSNALKFTDKGGKIEVRIREDNRYCYVDFKDTGIGIPSDMLDFIFYRYEQADSNLTRMNVGTGIGLSLAKELTEMHGGTISVVSSQIDEYPDDHGTTFTVTIPKGKAHLEGRAGVEFVKANEQEEMVSDQRRFFGMREMIDFKAHALVTEDPQTTISSSVRSDVSDKTNILLVEDSAHMRSLIIRLLEVKGYTVDVAVDGQDGLEKAKELHPDIIITDVMMPIMDGYQMTRAIREDKHLKQTPIIMLTAKTEVEARIDGLESGADDYLTKPFNLKELIARIKSLIKNHETIKEYQNSITKNYEATTNVLISTIDAKDHYTYGHSERVAQLMEIFAKRLDYPKEEVDKIKIISFLHDIGKIGTPENILNKEGPLTKDEFEEMKLHPVRGYKILQPIDFLKGYLENVYYHHERFDGSGYPEGLAGSSIPVESRMLSIVDSYDAMSTNRPYRNSLSKPIIIAELEENAGTQFDPTLVKIFLDIIKS